VAQAGSWDEGDELGPRAFARGCCDAACAVQVASDAALDTGAIPKSTVRGLSVVSAGMAAAAINLAQATLVRSHLHQRFRISNNSTTADVERDTNDASNRLHVALNLSLQTMWVADRFCDALSGRPFVVPPVLADLLRLADEAAQAAMVLRSGEASIKSYIEGASDR
jgi:hypothetical protein